ncbi:MAG: hypothetical protein AAGC67_13095 [Myxococcota bacterium]
MIAELAYALPFAFWSLLCAGALLAFARAVTAPPREDLETRGVFSTLSDRLGNAASASRVRRALGLGIVVGVPITFGACRVVWRADHGIDGSTLVLIAAGWLFLSIGGIATAILSLDARR